VSIQNKSKRLERLETQAGLTETVGAIIIVGMEPSEGEPHPSGEGFAYMLKGELAGSQLVKEPQETWENFKARVEASQ
jgi:hypothetical protein